MRARDTSNQHNREQQREALKTSYSYSYLQIVCLTCCCCYLHPAAALTRLTTQRIGHLAFGFIPRLCSERKTIGESGRRGSSHVQSVHTPTHPPAADSEHNGDAGNIVGSKGFLFMFIWMVMNLIKDWMWAASFTTIYTWPLLLWLETLTTRGNTGHSYTLGRWNATGSGSNRSKILIQILYGFLFSLEMLGQEAMRGIACWRLWHYKSSVESKAVNTRLSSWLCPFALTSLKALVSKVL